MSYLEVHLLYKYLGIFPKIFVSDFQFNPLLLRRHTLYDILFDLLKYLLARNMVYLDKYVCTWVFILKVKNIKNVILLLGSVFYKCQLSQLS